MSKFSSRRRFLKSSLVGGVGGVVALPLLARAAGAAPAAGPDVCVTLCNHWSYIGIGWQLGIESCVLAVTDAMEMVDREPHVKTYLEMDARGYEFMAEKFPEVATRLAKYLAAGKLELIGGSYSQPMGTTVGGESNIRQIVVGRETIRKALGYEVATMLHEEEFTHPQLPQLSRWPGCKYASLAQVDTWGRAGCPRLDYNAIFWKGIDGTTILDRAEERLVRLLARREPVGRLGGVQEAQEARQALGLLLGGVRLGIAGGAGLSLRAGQVPGVGQGGPHRVRYPPPVPGRVRRRGQGNHPPPHGRLEQIVHLGAGRRPGPHHATQDGRAAAGRRSVRRRRLVAGREVAGRVDRQGLEGHADLAEPRRGAVRVFPLAGRPLRPRRAPGRQAQLPLGRDRLQLPRRLPEGVPAGPGHDAGGPRPADRQRQRTPTAPWPSPC